MISFEQRAVGFLDILGFSNFICDAEKQNATLWQLHTLQTVVENQTAFEKEFLKQHLPVDVIPKYIFVSDSIIISAPLTYGKYDGLVVIALKTLQLSLKLLELGFLLRGSLHVGSVLHNDTNIFGTGYMEAYKSEKTVGHPRVLMTDAALKHWRSSTHFGLPCEQTELCRTYDGAYMLDTLKADYIRGVPEVRKAEDAFVGFYAHANANLQKLEDQPKPREKWVWMVNYLNDAARRQQINVQPMKVV